MIIKLKYIAGYECLRDGTQEETATSIQGILNIMESYEIDYDKSQQNDLKYLESIWDNRFDDGGGRGWFDIDYSDEKPEYVYVVTRPELGWDCVLGVYKTIDGFNQDYEVEYASFEELKDSSRNFCIFKKQIK